MHLFILIVLNMPHCVAYNCNNKSDNNPSISYHRLPGPSRKLVWQAWIDAIGRTDLPKKVYLCAEHFTEESFDPSHDLKQRLLPEDSRIKRMLLPDAIPTIFDHRETKSSRVTSQVREKKKEKQEVHKFYVQYLFISNRLGVFWLMLDAGQGIFSTSSQAPFIFSIVVPLRK